MKSVYKYDLNPAGATFTQLNLPINSVVLSAKNQYNNVVLYVLVDPTEAIMIKRFFMVSGTGHVMKNDDVGEFIDTVMLFDGSLVAHVFEML